MQSKGISLGSLDPRKIEMQKKSRVKKYISQTERRTLGLIGKLHFPIRNEKLFGIVMMMKKESGIVSV